MTAAPSARITAPFDAAAAGYDDEFERQRVTRSLRSVVQGTLLGHFRPGAHVLELNCGTGTDAIALAGRRVRVTCIDSSPEMIAQAAAKAERNGLGRLITFRELDFEQIDSAGFAEFDGAFSNFGGLNCSPRPGIVIGKVARLMKPGSVLVACLLNRTSLWESAAFIARGRFSKAFRRWRPGGIDATVGGMPLHVWYYSPGGVAKMLAPWFEVIQIYGLSIVSPPPGAAAFISSHPGLTDRLLRFDGAIRTMPPFRSLGDHFVVAARRISQ
jgi:ubiquinone/menaquinone biosynthesis C-methylase UbiE